MRNIDFSCISHNNVKSEAQKNEGKTNTMDPQSKNYNICEFCEATMILYKGPIAERNVTYLCINLISSFDHHGHICYVVGW